MYVWEIFSHGPSTKCQINRILQQTRKRKEYLQPYTSKKKERKKEKSHVPKMGDERDLLYYIIIGEMENCIVCVYCSTYICIENHRGDVQSYHYICTEGSPPNSICKCAARIYVGIL